MADPANPLQELREIRDEEARWKRHWEKRRQPRRDWLIRYAAKRGYSQGQIAQAAGRTQARIQQILSQRL